MTHEERETIIRICNQDEYVNLPPSQIVPILADKGVYIASESSFYRVLHDNEQIRHRVGPKNGKILQSLPVIVLRRSIKSGLGI